MFRFLRHRAFALLALLVLALGATGLAHRAPSAAAEELASYLRMGVTLDDICGMSGMGAAGADCPLCRVDPGFLPPEPTPGCQAQWLTAAGLSAAEARYPAPFRPRAPSNGPRAPPTA